ncbi:uncharacterized protein LOC129939870 [Eupeodes corollae]|uniref:uncharacterized protein LOC129939870 n=1 Tax=Eupeodes corollae TaxID=290404 RepID=UPI00249271A5|nr:uncharacterized protein LOC129939870 [Eupeodes corollae]
MENENINMENEKELKWTEELTSELIFHYEMYPILYNPRHPYFLKRVKKMDAFKSIRTALKPLDQQNMTLDAIERKIHELQTQFCKEFCEVNRSQKSKAGTGDIYIPKLWCYDQLYFLEPYCKTIKSVANIEPNENEDTVPSHSNSEATQQDDSNDFTPKRKRTSSGAEEINLIAELIRNKMENKSSYSWLGKQVVFEMDRIQNESIKRKTSWAIQKILHECAEEDLALRKSVSPSFKTMSSPSGSRESF